MLGGADETDHRLPRVYADADIKTLPGCAKLLAERLQGFDHLPRRCHRHRSVLGLVCRCPPERHDAIADVLI